MEDPNILNIQAETNCQEICSLAHSNHPSNDHHVHDGKLRGCNCGEQSPNAHNEL